MKHLFEISRVNFLWAILAVTLPAPATPQPEAPLSMAATHPLSGATILIIRHAEKPETGPGLTQAGENRAAADARYFKNFSLGSEMLGLDYLVAAADSQNSQRSRLTLEPLSAELGLKLDLSFKSTQYEALAESLRSHQHGKGILICWHHHQIPDLLRSLGVDPGKLLPKGQWPDQEFGWVLQLRYDDEGHLLAKKTRRIVQKFAKADSKQAK